MVEGFAREWGHSSLQLLNVSGTCVQVTVLVRSERANEECPILHTGAEWGYLKHGVLVRTDKAGLTH